MTTNSQRALALCRQDGLPEPELEFRFHPTRRWRFDLAFPEAKIAVEIEGGAWIQGRHNRAPGFIKDCIKYNAATLLGWRVLRYTPEQLGQMTTDVAELLDKWRAEEKAEKAVPSYDPGPYMRAGREKAC